MNPLGPNLAELGAPAPEAAGHNATAPAMPDSILQIPVQIEVVIGSTRMPLSKLAGLGPGSIITLDQRLGAPAAIMVNGLEVAKGELFVLDEDGGRLGIRITATQSRNTVAAV